MPVSIHPPQGSIVIVDYRQGFKKPEMVKRRLAIVLSPKIEERADLCAVVPLSTTEPKKIMPYRMKINIPFKIPESWGKLERWVKGDMINTVGFHRIDLLRLGRDITGKRQYQYRTLPATTFKNVRQCVLHGIGMPFLTKRL
ncbi:MAG: type II toxin-antitoxin system PemK/MazF family toxin [Pseudomonadota bacterium]